MSRGSSWRIIVSVCTTVTLLLLLHIPATDFVLLMGRRAKYLTDSERSAAAKAHKRKYADSDGYDCIAFCWTTD
jgi:hypothetical protein